MGQNHNRYEKSFGGREKYFPCKLKKDTTGDCVIRAIAHATEQDYMQVMRDLFALGLELGQLPNQNKCYDVYLERLGWKKHSPLKDKKGKKFQVRHFPAEEGKNYIIHTTSHLTAIMDKVIYDIWYCGESAAYSFYTKED